MRLSFLHLKTDRVKWSRRFPMWSVFQFRIQIFTENVYSSEGCTFPLSKSTRFLVRFSSNNYSQFQQAWFRILSNIHVVIRFRYVEKSSSCYQWKFKKFTLDIPNFSNFLSLPFWQKRTGLIDFLPRPFKRTVNKMFFLLIFHWWLLLVPVDIVLNFVKFSWILFIF